METHYEQEYLSIEKNNPWYIRRRELVSSFLGDITKKSEILDYGCGVGQFLHFLQQKGFKNLNGFEPSKYFAHKRLKGITIYKHETDIQNKKFDVIFMLDVLEHIKDDAAALKRISSYLKPNGTLIITVPTFNFLWSYQDVINKHYRRYNVGQLNSILPSTMKLVRSSFWNFFLFAPTAITKILKNKKARSSASDFSTMAVSSLTLNVFDFFLRLENTAIKYGINFPIGTSLIFVLKKK